MTFHIKLSSFLNYVITFTYFKDFIHRIFMSVISFLFILHEQLGKSYLYCSSFAERQYQDCVFLLLKCFIIYQNGMLAVSFNRVAQLIISLYICSYIDSVDSGIHKCNEFVIMLVSYMFLLLSIRSIFQFKSLMPVQLQRSKPRGLTVISSPPPSV